MRPLMAVCKHCYELSVGSYQPDPEDHEVFVCARHAPPGVQLYELPLVDYRVRTLRLVEPATVAHVA